MEENEKEELQRDQENYVLGILKRIQNINSSRVSNIESNDSQNVGLEVYKDILLEPFQSLVLPL